MACKSIVLVGPTGGGKSTCGNLLLGKNRFTATRGFSASSTTTKIESEFTEDKSWLVFDTPGLGDVPLKKSAETDDAWKARIEENNFRCFHDITTVLSKAEGPIVLVFVIRQKCGPSIKDQLEALRLCTPNYNPVLLLPVTESSHEWTKDTQADEKEQARADYHNWVTTARDEVITQTGAQFSAVLGISRNKRLDNDHPAHPQRVLEVLGGGCFFLQPASVLTWQRVITDAENRAQRLTRYDSAIDQIAAQIAAAEEHMEKLQWYQSGGVSLAIGAAVGAGTTFLAIVFSPLAIPLASIAVLAGCIRRSILKKEIVLAMSKLADMKRDKDEQTRLREQLFENDTTA